jgi:methyl-accepting chemotaxis protein
MHSWRTRISTRLTLSFAVVLAFMAFSTALSLWRLNSVDRMAKALVDDELSKQRLVAEWQSAVNLNATRAIAIAKSDSLELGDYFEKYLTEGDKQIAGLAHPASGNAPSDAEAALLNRIDAAAGSYIAIRDEVFKLKAVGKTIEVEKLVSSKLEGALADYQAALHALGEHQKLEAQAIARDASDVFSNSVVILLGVGAATIILGGLLALYLSRSIVKPVQAAASLAARVAAGDLTSVVETGGDDEIGDLMHALKRMNESLTRMAREIQDGTAEIESTIMTIADDNGDLSDRTAAQANSLRAIAMSMDALMSTAKNNAQHTLQANALAASAAEVAINGGDVVSEVVRTMRTINESSKKIEDIIGVMDGIAFQTNILALNASVEAARAGEEGRGFAVVANEVRTLSQRSAMAAKEIRELISASVANAASGALLVDEAGATMQRIVDSINGVTDIVACIKTSSEQQTADLLSIGHSIDQIDSATQQNSELVQDAVHAIGELTDQARRVATSVQQFRLLDGKGHRVRLSSVGDAWPMRMVPAMVEMTAVDVAGLAA